MMISIALRDALRDIVRNPVRSLIILQGVIWGTALGILPPALIQGSRRAAVERAAELGTDRILVIDPGTGEKALSWDLPGLIEERFPGRLRAAAAYAQAPFSGPQKEGRGPGDSPPPEGGREGPAGLLLVEGGALEARGYEIAEGRWLTEEELRDGAPAAVLEPRAAALLGSAMTGGGSGLLDREIDPGDGLFPLRVVGVTRPLPRSAIDQDVLGYEKSHWLHGLVEEIKDSLGILPTEAEGLTSEEKIIVPRRRYPAVAPGIIELRADPAQVADIARDVREMLLAKGLDPIVTHNPIVQFLFSENIGFLQKIHWVVFAVCILVGTVIVACLRILTVLERREEIAIRRVEGATVVAIGAQFTLETAAFCFAGALAGVPLAFLLAWLRSRIDPSNTVTWVVPHLEVFLSVAGVLVAGLAGGLLPAIRAARIDPAQALGKE